ncbi:MAG: hypothetical protein ABJX32_10000 [Tateyamaria sp.]|uniref:hypothetical protein n=1 Tax=Tateyamaria sp. TaxID=1929288 RepID=UPI00329DDB5C
MSEVALKGDELKKLLKVAKKQEIAFAYAPGKKPEDDIFSMDRKKAPEVVSRQVRKESDGSKYAFGFASVSGKVISLKCERELPGMSKKLKKLFKAEKCPLNVVILDGSGKVLEEDIEELPDDGLLDDGDDQDGNELDEEARRKTVLEMASSIKNKLAALPDNVRKALAEHYAKAVKALKDGDLDAAENGFNKLNAAINKVENANTGTGDSSAPPPPPPPSNPDVIKLLGVASSLEKRIDGLQDGESKTKLLGVLERLNNQIEAEDIKAAGETAKVLGAAITKASAAQTQEAKDTPQTDEDEDDSSDETPLIDHTGTEDGRAWSDAFANLEAPVLAALGKGFGDVSKMRAAWSAFTGAGGQQKYEGALKLVPGIEKLLADAEAAESSDAEKDIPTNVVPFVRARLGWIKARTSLRGEMGKLQNAIIAQCKGEEYEGIANDTKELFEYLEALDDKLENALEALVQEPDGDKRETLKKTARSVLSDFQAELETPFFKDVDGNNGFTNVSVRGTAQSALSAVNSALAS